MSRTLPTVAYFVLTALAIALTAGFGLGLWLLLSRTEGLTTFGVVWLALVQVHGTIQLFGFAALFLMGVALHVLPRFRGAPSPPRPLVVVAYGATVLAIVLRTVAQPVPELPGRDTLLVLSSVLLLLGAMAFASAAIGALRGGSNPHRPDELVIGAGLVGAPVAALLVGLAVPLHGAALLVDQAADDRAIWAMLLGCLATSIFGVWARLAPGFVATPPARPRRLLGSAAVWLTGVAGTILAVPFSSLLLLAGAVGVTWAVGIFGPSIARQPLPEHARATRLALRSAFAWAITGAALLVWYDVRGVAGGATVTYLELSAARHAFALGLVALAIYGVAARAVPSFVDRRLWSQRLAWAIVGLADLGVALRVVPQALGVEGPAVNAVVALSGIAAYGALLCFAVNIVQTMRSAPLTPDRTPQRGAPITLRTR